MDVVSEIKNAIELIKQKKFKKAEEIYKNILKTDKNNALALSALGLLYLNVGLFKKSEKIFQQAYNINPSLVSGEGLGLVKFYLNKSEEACDIFEKIIDKTKNFDVFDKYINSLLILNRNKEAYNCAKLACKIFPLKKESYYNLAFCCIPTGKFQEGFNVLQQLLKRHPKYGDAWEKLGILYEMLYFDDDMAEKCYKKVLRYGNKNAGYYNLAISASKRGDIKKAINYAKKVKVEAGDESFLNFMLATFYFKERNFKKAYKHYVKKEEKPASYHITAKLKNKWDGKIYKDETLLVYCDQGAGDCIMFSRYLPFLEKKFKKIKVLCPKVLYNLFKRSFKDYKKIQFYEFRKNLPRYDKYTVQSNLPYYLKMPLDNIPSSDGYLYADEKITEKYSKIIKSGKLKVGVVWEAGGTGWRELLQRTLNVSLYEPFFELKGAEFYSLQVKPSMDNYKNYNLIDLGKDFKDFDETAGALKNLDLVVTVDTSVAHLAGALGVKTFMLLPYTTDWRWFDDDKKTEWYSSVTIFKQPGPRKWDIVIKNIKQKLEKMI